MTRKEAINIIQGAIGQIEWDQPMHIAVALDKAVEALEQPEIIRCKDCKHGEIYTQYWDGAERVECHAHEAQGYDHEEPHYLNWFCADGKRKEFDPLEET